MGEALELAGQVWTAVENGKTAELGELFADHADISTSAGQGRGPEYATELFTRHRSGYPDLQHKVLDAIESGDGQAVAQRIAFTATHLGELRGPFGIVPPTGRRLRWRTSDHVRAGQGRIVSWHAHFDRLSLLQQLGIAPPMDGGGHLSPAKAVIRRILGEVFGEGRLEILDELMTDDFVNHRVPPGLDTGVGSVKRIVAMERSAFPDLRYTVEQEVEEGDMVITVTLAEGTHAGPIFGVEPTGRQVSWRQVHVARMKDGRMAEHWGVSDLASLWVQIGRAQPISRV